MLNLCRINSFPPHSCIFLFQGFFTKISDIEKMLSNEGKVRLAGIGHTISECRKEEDLKDFEDLDDYYQL